MALWGSCGLLGTYEDPTVLGHKMFGVSGMLCLVAVVNCESPVSVSELHSCLRFFMSRQTASRRLRSLVADGLLEESGRRYTARADWRSRLDDIVATYPSGNKRRIQLVDNIAGERRSFTANTIIRDPSWRKKDAQGALRLCSADAEALGVDDGGRVRITTPGGVAVAVAEINDTMQEGHVSLPNGHGLAYSPAGGDPEIYGVAPNELTTLDWCDPIVGTPWHKHVPARLEAVSP